MEIGAGGAEEGNGEVMELTKVTYNGAEPKTPEERQKQAIISVLTFQPEYNDHPGYNPDPDKLADAIVAALKDQLAEAQKASEWQKITPENGPNVGDEIYRLNGSWTVRNATGVEIHSSIFINGYTHFRPINPPTESEEKHG
jgi:hypothetical protein